MYLIVGLGNPEEEYSRTRHNMGFNTINKIAKEYKIEIIASIIENALFCTNEELFSFCEEKTINKGKGG